MLAQRRQRADQEGAPAEALALDAEFFEFGQPVVEERGLQGAEFEDQRLDRLLLPLVAPHLGQQSLVDRALVGAVLVDEIEAVGALGQQERVAKLPEQAERRQVRRLHNLVPGGGLALALVPRRRFLGDAIPGPRWQVAQPPQLLQLLQPEAGAAARGAPAREDGADGIAERGGDLGLGQEAHLGLGRVDVDVDRVGGQVEEDRGERVPAAREEGPVGRLQSLGQAPRRGPAAVDEEADVPPAGARRLRPADDAPDPRPGDLDRLQRQ